MRFIGPAPWFVIDEIAILHEFADERIDLLQAEWGLGATFQIAAHEAIFLDAHLQRSSAGFLERENPEDAAHANFSLLTMDGFAERADVGADAARTPQQLRSAERSALGVLLRLDAIPAAFLTHVFAQQLAGLGIERANE
jgi:hypothetical protein